MSGRGSESTNLPEPTGPNDDSFSYSLTRAGKRALADFGDKGERATRRRAWERTARAHGRRFGTVCGRWRETKHVPEVRLSGVWLRAAGFDLGQEYEVGVEKGALMIRAV